MDEELSGASSIPFLDQITTLTTWAPMLSRLQAINEAKTPHDRAVAVVKAMEWAATKSQTKVDDEVLGYIEAILMTDAGKAFFDYVVRKVTGAV